MGIEENYFRTTRNYSEIEGLQTGAVDVYELENRERTLIIRFYSTEYGHTQCESGHVTGLSFEEMRKMLCYMAENAVRRGAWMDIVRDFCAQKGCTFYAGT